MRPENKTELVPEEQLYELFERRRPEAASFRAGVERRLAERSSDRADGDGVRPLESAFQRRVASLDPTGGALLGSALGTKWVPAALALPAILLASVVGGFMASARSIASVTEGALPGRAGTPRPLRSESPSPNRHMKSGQRLLGSIQMITFLGFLAAPVIGGQRAVDVLLIMMLVAMTSLVLCIRGMAREGLLVRSEVSRLALATVLAVLTGSFFWFYQFSIGFDSSTLGLGWSAATLAVGTAVCLVFAWRTIAEAPAIAAGLVLMAAFLPLGATSSDEAALRGQWARLELKADELDKWEEAAALHTALRAVGAELPDTTGARKEIQRALADETIEVHPRVWTGADHMGLMGTAEWRQLATRALEARAVERMLSRGRVPRTDYNEYEFSMMMAVSPPTAEERGRLIAGIDEAWPELGDHAALDDAIMLTRMLDRLDPALGDARRESVHALLEHYWMPHAKASAFFKRAGGFSSDPQQFRTSFGDATWNGIELMARFGVPDAIDLRVVQGYLRRESQVMGLGIDFIADVKALERASLLRLQREIGLPARSWIEHLMAERLLIASTLLVLLCLLAIRLAPREGKPVGALP